MTITELAPATPAAKHAAVVRNMFTHGSRRVIMRPAVRTENGGAAEVAEAPAAITAWAQSRRADRSLAMVANTSASALSVNPIWLAASSTPSPEAISARR